MGSRESSTRDGLIVALTAALVLLANLGGPRLWDDDEPRNAGCAREMLARGDWVVPTFNAELRTHKPVLVYWCMMVSYSLFGIHELSARLPSALAAIGTALLVWRMGRRLFGPSAGVWAGVAASTMFLLTVAGRWATPDSVLIFTTTLAMWCYVRSVFANPSESSPGEFSGDYLPRLLDAGRWFPRSWYSAAAIYAAMGLAVLAKGPVGLVLPTAVIGMFLLIQRLPKNTPAGQEITNWLARGQSLVLAAVRPFAPLHFLHTCWEMRPITAVLVVAAVAAPWYVAVGMATEGEFLRGFFLEHNLKRATSAMEGHRGGFWFYPLALLIGALPWSLLLGPLVLEVRRQSKSLAGISPGVTFALCWIGVFIGAFSVASTKLPNYITPCVPAAALLAGCIAAQLARTGFSPANRKQAAAVFGVWPQLSFISLAAVGVLLLLSAGAIGRVLLPGDYSLLIIGLAPLSAGLLGLWLWRADRATASLAVFAGGAMAMMLAIFAYGLDRIDRWQTSDQLLAAVFSRTAKPTIASYGVLEPSWVVYGRQPILELPLKTDKKTPATTLKTGPEQIREYLFEHYDGYVITTRSRLPELQPILPPGVEVLVEKPQFMKVKGKFDAQSPLCLKLTQEQLVVLGRNLPELPSPERAASLERLRR